MDNIFLFNGKEHITLPDKPCMEFRSVHLCVFPETSLDELKNA